MEASNRKIHIKTQDYFLTGEEFEIVKDENTGVLKTIPQPEQLDRYYETEDYLSHSDQSKSIFEKCYQFAKQSNLKSKINLVRSVKPSGTVLDIGAGVGDFALALQENGYKVDGVEPNQIARTVAANKGIHLKETTSDLSDHSYDVITMYHVLEHVPDIEKQKSELDRLLKKDGVLIIALPNHHSYDARFYKSYWAGYDAPRHLFHFNQLTVRKFFSPDFVLERTVPLNWDAFYVSILSARYQKKSLAFLRGLWIGLLSNMKASKSGEYSSLTYVFKRK